MKIALYIEDGLEQIILTPDTHTERHLLSKLSDGSRVVSVKKGGFYACQGGWVRQNDHKDITKLVLSTPSAQP